jgi:hypothetical protein
MTWTNNTSTAEDIAVDRAWDALNSALDRRVRVSLQMRVTACVADTLSMVTLVRRLAVGEIGRSAARVMRMEEWNQSDKRTAPKTEWDAHLSFQLAAAMKATYYFIRALQDSIYAALLEATGRRAGGYSSMQDCAKNAENPIHALIAEALPDYFAWFADLRAVRNKMKIGASTAFGYRGRKGTEDVRLILQEVDDAKRYVSPGREVSLVDIEMCLTQTEALLRWSSEHVTAAA